MACRQWAYGFHWAYRPSLVVAFFTPDQSNSRYRPLGTVRSTLFKHHRTSVLGLREERAAEKSTSACGSRQACLPVYYNRLIQRRSSTTSYVIIHSGCGARPFCLGSYPPILGSVIAIESVNRYRRQMGRSSILFPENTNLTAALSPSSTMPSTSIRAPGTCSARDRSMSLAPS